MTSAQLLAELGERVADDGPGAHHLLLQHLSRLVADRSPGAAALLADPASPAPARQRALAVASAALVRDEEASGDRARLWALAAEDSDGSGTRP